MTDTLIYKYTDEQGRWGKYLLRKNGTIRYECSNGNNHSLITPDTLINLVRLKTRTGKVYINVDALKKACQGLQWI